jgi:hypothetical protein
MRHKTAFILCDVVWRSSRAFRGALRIRSLVRSVSRIEVLAIQLL